MGGWLGVGNSSAKTDRSNTLAGFGDLNKAFGFGSSTAGADTTTGTATTSSGVDALHSAMGYFRNLLSGGRSSALSAVAPGANAAQAQQDAQRRQIANSGTARGGGVNAVQQQAKDNSDAEVDNALFGVRSQAAGQEAAVGSDLAKVGTTEQGLGLSAEEIASNSANALTKDSIASRMDSYKINKAQQQDVANSIEGILAGFAQ